MDKISLAIICFSFFVFIITSFIEFTRVLDTLNDEHDYL